MSEVPVIIQGFKGLNLREPAGMVQDDELVLCQNFNIGRAGELTKRNGFTQLHDGTTLGTTKNVSLVGHYQTPDYSQIIAVTSDHKLWKSEDGATWTQITYDGDVAVKSGVQYVNKFYMAADVGVFVWDGVTLSLTASTPAGSFCVVYKDRLFVLSSTSTNNSRIYFSAIADFATWPSTNFFDVNPGDGDFLTCLAIIQDLLILFKTGTTWALYLQGSPQNWVVRNINPEIGCISKDTPREIEGFLYFVGTRGVYRTDGNLFEDISQSIEPLFNDRIVNLTTVNIDSAAWWEDRFIVLLHPTPSTYKYFVYHLRTEGWTEWVPASGILPTSFLEIVSATPSKGLYTGNKNENGKVYRYGSSGFTDGGQTYNAKMQTKDFDFALPSMMKRGKWLGIDVFAAGGTVKVVNTVEGEELETKKFDGENSRRLHKVGGPSYFRIWNLRIENQYQGDFIFYSTTLWMHRKRSTIKAAT